MRRTLAMAALAAALAFPATSLARVRPLLSLGLGFPELVHAEAGLFVHPRVSVEARAGWLLFNVMVGAGVTGWLVGETHGDRPPKHALLVSADFRFNPTLRPLRLDSGAETLGSAATSWVGYGFTLPIGFSVRAMAGAIWYSEGGRLAVGANVIGGVGWVF